MERTGRPSVTLFIVAMNEVEGMRAIMPQIDRSWVDQIILADGNSTDGTQEYAREQGIEVVPQIGKGGRNAFRTGFAHIKSDVVITFSPNGKSVPEVIPALIDKMAEGYDMVIASRYKGHAKSSDDNLISWFANRFFTNSINLLFGGHYTDAMVIYRAYRTRMFYELELDRDEHYPLEGLFRTIVGIEPLLSIRAAKRKLRITEIPADEPNRIGSFNKFPKVSGGLIYFGQMLRELWHWR
jgi:glycosyltransferase involved in cell wall biosynthesis